MDHGISRQPDSVGRLVGRTVVDIAGQSLGVLAGTYVDAQSSRLLFGAVRMRPFGRRRLVMVSLVDAEMRIGTVSVRCGRELARRGPWVRPGQEFDAADEEQLFAHYELPFSTGVAGGRRLAPAETG